MGQGRTESYIIVCKKMRQKYKFFFKKICLYSSEIGMAMGQGRTKRCSTPYGFVLPDLHSTLHDRANCLALTLPYFAKF